MRIIETKAYPLYVHQDRPISGFLPYSQSLSKNVRKGYASCLIEISTDENITGWGESIVREVPQATAEIVQRLLAPIILDQDPFNVEVLWEQMFSALRTRGHSRGYFVEAISGVDIAIWDIIGKTLRLPITSLIGGSFRDKIKCYASSILQGSPSDVAETAVRLTEKGHDQIKVKIGMDTQKDIQTIKAIRDAIGYDVDIMVDANSGYNARSAIHVGRKLERYDIMWFEEPVPPDDLDGYAEVSRSLDLAVCGSESLFSIYDYKDLIRAGVDILQADVARAGGITQCKKIVALAEAYNRSFTPHIGLSACICRAASLQLAANIPDTIFMPYEYMESVGLTQPTNPLGNELVPIENFKSGYVSVPQEPGLGVALEKKDLKRFVTD